MSEDETGAVDVEAETLIPSPPKESKETIEGVARLGEAGALDRADGLKEGVVVVGDGACCSALRTEGVDAFGIAFGDSDTAIIGGVPVFVDRGCSLSGSVRAGAGTVEA